MKSDISEVDKNFIQRQANAEEELRVLHFPCEELTISGLIYENCGFRRVPFRLSDSLGRGMRITGGLSAGARLRFSTDSSLLELSVKTEGFINASNTSFLVCNGFTLLEQTEEGEKFVCNFIPENRDGKEFILRKKLQGGIMRNYVLYFPIYVTISEFSLGIEKKANLGKGKPYREELPILYYGSSITHGLCATRADNPYPSLISKWNNIDFINMGFSGNAHAELPMAEFLAKIKCSLFVFDYDWNAESEEALRETHYPFYQKFREINPSVPILFVSMPSTDWDETVCARRYKIIKDSYVKARKLGDTNVHLLNGSKLFGKEDRINCTVDGCHPTDLGFYRMAKGIYRKLQSIDSKLK